MKAHNSARNSCRSSSHQPCCKGACSHSILHQPPALHDKLEPLLRVPQHRNVLERVAFHKQQVCQVSFLR